MNYVTYKSELIKAALQEYLVARQELMLHIGSYSNQSSVMRIGTGLLIVAVPATVGIFYTDRFASFANGVTASIVLALCITIIAFSITVVTYYIVFQVLENQLALVGQAQRIVIIERKLNKLLKEPLFNWESEMSPRLWSLNNPFGLLHPMVWSRCMARLLVLIFGNLLPIFLYFKVLHLHHGHGLRWLLWIPYAFVRLHRLVWLSCL